MGLVSRGATAGADKNGLATRPSGICGASGDAPNRACGGLVQSRSVPSAGFFPCTAPFTFVAMADTAAWNLVNGRCVLRNRRVFSQRGAARFSWPVQLAGAEA